MNLISDRGSNNPKYTLAAYNEIFGLDALYVPVENSGAAGTRDAHWRESVMGHELMTGYLNNGDNPLRKITVGSLADMGYEVNMTAADSYSPPSAAVNFAAGTQQDMDSLYGVMLPVTDTVLLV